MQRRSPTPGVVRRHHRAGLVILALIAVMASACGSPDGSEAGGSSTTSAPATTPTTPAAESATDELAAEDVPAYLAAYQEALTTSTLQVGDGEPRPIDRAEFIDGLTIRAGADSIGFVLGPNGIDEIVAELDGQIWVGDDPAVLDEVSLAFDAIEPGDVWQATIALTKVTDPAATETVVMRLDTDLIGGGQSSIEVVDGVATISGVLGTETYLQLRDVIEDHPEVDTLVMLSVEGSENDAINLHTSRLIRQAGWTTWLPAAGDISSGGVDMFLAGRERVIEPGGFLGVHSWGSSDGDVVAAELPDDHPAHRAQLDYVTEMLGPEVGPAFYFYTLDAAPAASIHRMTDDEIETYGLATGPPPTSLPPSVTGPAAAYLQLVEQVYLKHRVLGCEIDGDAVTAELESEELGRVEVTVDGGRGQLRWADLPSDLTATHPVTDSSIDGSQITLQVDLDLDDLIGEDTGNADLAIDCRP